MTSISKMIRMALLHKDMQQIQLANKLGISKASVNNYLTRDNWRISDLVSYCDAMGFDVKIQLVDRESGKMIDCE